MEEQKQPNKVNFLHQEDIKPDIQKDFPEISKKSGLPKWVIILITVLVMTAIGVADYFIYNNYFVPDEPIACTTEAKICPDGSSVGRIAPNCKFAECPEVVDPTVDWKTYRNEEYGWEIKYPEDWEINKARNIEISFIKEVIGLNPKDKVYYYGDIGTMDLISIEISLGSLDKISELYGLLNEESRININGFDAFLIEKEHFGELFYIFENPNNKNIRIAFRSNIDLLLKNQAEKTFERNELKDIFNQILSTFKFIESTSTTYIEIDKLGFKIPFDNIIANEITYNIENSSVSFSTETLNSMSKYCESQGRGSITKILGTPSNPTSTKGVIEEVFGSPASDYFEARMDSIKQFDGFFLLWTGPQATCTDDEYGYNLEKELIQAIRDGFKNVSLIY